MESKEKSNPAAIAIFYGIAAVTIAAYGYGIGGMASLRAGAIYAVVGLVLAFACVGFAPRFIVVGALATGMLGSMMRASIAPEITSLIPKQNTIDYLQRMVTVCAPSALEAACTVDFASPVRACSIGSAKRS